MLVAADAYDQFMGRYSAQLAPQMADLAGVDPGMHVIDVGCGPGALTSELIRRVGADRVASMRWLGRREASRDAIAHGNAT